MNNKDKEWVGDIKELGNGMFILGVLFTIAFFIFAYDISSMRQEIYSMQEEIDSMPHYFCHNETIIEELEIAAFNPYKLTLINSGFFECVNDWYDEVLCDKGIEVYSCLGEITNYNDEPGTCYTKTIKEVCEIVPKSEDSLSEVDNG